jgi:hypothetical protein
MSLYTFFSASRLLRLQSGMGWVSHGIPNPGTPAIRWERGRTATKGGAFRMPV